MCVIIVKPKGIELPSKEELQSAWLCNPHGAGFATHTKHHKSLSFEAFYKQLRKVDVSEPCIIHFRLATHGSVKRANCHPFNEGDVWFAHNGILDIQPDGDMTDSETAFRKFIYPSIEQYGIDGETTNNVIRCIIGSSRFAILRGEEIYTYGQYIVLDGRLYSNTRHLSRYLRRW